MRDPRNVFAVLEAIAAIERHQDGDKTAFETDELRRTCFLYFDIDTDIVWQAVTTDVPFLKPAIVSLLAHVEGRL